MNVSVAMATYNGERFLVEQLESLARQTLQPSELVIYDDGSTDGTLSLLSDFSRSSPLPVHVHSGEARLGFADAFLAAAASCTGALIAFSDQDDVWLPTKLERCRAAFDDADEVLVAIHSSTVVDEGLVSTGRRYPDVRAEYVAPPLAADPWLAVRGMSMVLDAGVVRLVGAKPRPPSHYLERTPMHHDEWLYAVASALGAVAFLAEPLALYRQHGRNVTGAPPGIGARMREALTTGSRYYGLRRDQARELERLFSELAASADDRKVAQRAASAAASFKNLGDRLDRRLGIYEPGVSVGDRTRRLVRLARRGGYARGSGFGPSALARDALMIALGRRG